MSMQAQTQARRPSPYAPTSPNPLRLANATIQAVDQLAAILERALASVASWLMQSDNTPRSPASKSQAFAAKRLRSSKASSSCEKVCCRTNARSRQRRRTMNR